MGKGNPNWKKGVSANPGGLTKERRALLADANAVALEVLLDKGATGDKTKDRELWDWGLNHPDPDIRVKVWFRAQDYAFGSPAHVLEVVGAGTHVTFNIEPSRPQTAEAWLKDYADTRREIALLDQGVSSEAPN